MCGMSLSIGMLVGPGRIEYSKGEFWLFKEGITAHTGNLIIQIQNERLALGQKLQFVAGV